MKKYYAEAALLIVTIIWGGTFFIIKGAVETTSPMMFVFLRFSLALVIVTPIFFKYIKTLTKPVIIAGLTLGFIYFLSYAFQTLGLKITSVSKSGFITGTFAVFTPIFQYIFERKKPGKGNIIGLFFVILGLVFLSSKGNSLFGIFDEIGSNFNFGDFLTLFCAILYALYVVYLDIVSKHNYKQLVFLQILITSIGGLTAAIILNYFNYEEVSVSFNFTLLYSLIYTAIFATIITTVLQTKYQKFVTPTKASLIFSLEPLFAVFFAYIFIAERLSTFAIIGCISILIGLLVSEFYDKIVYAKVSTS